MQVSAKPSLKIQPQAVYHFEIDFVYRPAIYTTCFKFDHC
jgi:hypothetical protein